MFNLSQNNTFEDILKRCLNDIDNSLDKRQGAIIYDALAPFAAELAQAYIALDVFSEQTYLGTATGENLDNRVADYGLTRIAATKAQRLATFVTADETPVAMTIDIGARFSIPNENGGYNFKVIAETNTTGTYILECETAGTVGNEYTGVLLPLTSINNLGTATLTTVYIAGEDIETDESLRNRAIAKVSQTPFGGNVADYKQFVEAQDGIGACLVIPVWDGGGTVKLVIITSSYGIPTEAKINEIQTLVDPTQNHGQGLGKAPIGHVVTVVAPTAYELTIEADISFQNSYTLESLTPLIEQAIANYIKQVQIEWANNTTVTIYISRLIGAIISVEGVTNVENLTVNNSTSNVTIDVTSTGNPYPIIKEVIINESE